MLGVLSRVVVKWSESACLICRVWRGLQRVLIGVLCGVLHAPTRQNGGGPMNGGGALKYDGPLSN